MKKALLSIVFLFNLAVTFASVDFNLSVQKLEMKDGRPILTKASKVDPGDTLLYILEITNEGEEEVKNLMPSIPIPEYTTLLPTMITPNMSFVVSVDKKKYKKYPYLTKDGRPISDSMYKSIRWTVDSMKPKEKRIFKFGVSVN